MAIKKVTVSYSPSSSAWVNALRRIEGIKVRIHDCVRREGLETAHLISIKFENGQLEKIKDSLYRSPLVKDVVFVNGCKRGFLMCIVRSRPCDLCGCSAVTERCFVRRGEYDPLNNKIRWTFIIEDSELQSLLGALRRNGGDVVVEESNEVEDGEDLTPQQVILLTRAVTSGFFDVPRRASVKELAEELGNTPASVSIGIRRAVKRLANLYLQGNLSR